MDKNASDVVTQTVTYYPAGGAMRIDGILYYVLKDHLGSASVMTNDDGMEVGQQRYYPYGETRWTTGNLFTDRLFTGQREMADLGIYHYNARLYSPYINQFLSADTIVPSYANPQSWNRYSYVTNNPLRYTDPSGHQMLENEYGGGCSTTGYCPGPSNNNTNSSNNNNSHNDDNEDDEDNSNPISPTNPTFENSQTWWADWWDTLMSNQYTPFAFASVQALAGWGQAIGIGLAGTGMVTFDPAMAEAGGALFLTSYFIGRASGLISTGATIYQYNHSLHGTNGTDVWVSVITSVAAYEPRLTNSMADINVLYNAYRLNNPAPVDIPFLTPPLYYGGN